MLISLSINIMIGSLSLLPTQVNPQFREPLRKGYVQYTFRGDIIPASYLTHLIKVQNRVWTPASKMFFIMRCIEAYKWIKFSNSIEGYPINESDEEARAMVAIFTELKGLHYVECDVIDYAEAFLRAYPSLEKEVKLKTWTYPEFLDGWPSATMYFGMPKEQWRREIRTWPRALNVLRLAAEWEKKNPDIDLGLLPSDYTVRLTRYHYPGIEIPVSVTGVRLHSLYDAIVDYKKRRKPRP